MAAMHCNREEFVSIAKPDCRFSHTLAVYLLRGLLFTKTLRLFVNRLSVGGFGGGGALTTAARRPERRTCSSCGGGGVGVIVKLTERSSVALMTKPPP